MVVLFNYKLYNAKILVNFSKNNICTFDNLTKLFKNGIMLLDL